MYNFYSKEDIERRLSKIYMNSVIIDANDAINDIMIQVGHEPFVRKMPDEIAKMITKDENSCAFVDYDGLMVFDNHEELENFRRY